MPDISLITKAIIAFAIAAALAVLAHCIYQAGAESNEVKWLVQNQKVADEAAERAGRRREELKRAQEQHAIDMADAASRFMAESAENERKSKDEKAAAVVAARTNGLWVTVQRDAGAGPVPAPGPGASPLARTGDERARLSDQAADFLIGESSDADHEIRRLQAKVKALQEIARSDRETCR